MNNKVVITCALTGVLTDPKKFNVPVTPEQMATAAQQAYDQGASIVHVHFRRQEENLGAFPSWEVDVVERIITAIKTRVPEVIINMSTGIIGSDISGPLTCLKQCKPDMAACNAGSLNYLKIRKDGQWAWPSTARRSCNGTNCRFGSRVESVRLRCCEILEGRTGHSRDQMVAHYWMQHGVSEIRDREDWRF